MSGAMSRCTKGSRDGRSVWVMTGGTCGTGRYTEPWNRHACLRVLRLKMLYLARLDLSVAGVFRLGVSKFTIRHAKRCETFESYIFIKHNTKQFQTFKFTHPDKDHYSDLAAVGISQPPSLFEGMDFEALGKSDEPAVHPLSAALHRHMISLKVACEWLGRASRVRLHLKIRRAFISTSAAVDRAV